jgi:hypothetical protein
LRSRSAWSWLLEKEARELAAARSFWIFLVAMGPLVGFCFTGAVRSYADVSGLGGTAGGVGEALAPLVGVWAPTFSACELAAAFLFPFVVIRLVSRDRVTGALKLELQHPMPALARVGAKALVLLGGWSLALLAPAAAVALWRAWGGSVFVPELCALVVGHLLNAGLAVALAAAAASVAEHPATAAILALGVTVGTWIVQFSAAVHGGAWEAAARYTPAAMVAEFQHGLVRLRAVLVALVLTAFGLVLAAVWMRLGVTWKRRAAESAAAACAAAILVLAGSRARASWDLSEDRANSWPRADEAVLRTIPETLRIEAHLAPEDPRRSDLERGAFARLERVLPRLDVRFVSATASGLFEQSAEGYGEIRYELDGRRLTSRSSTPEGVLEAVYELARIAPPAVADEPFRGHPLARAPVGAAWIFFGVWPAAVGSLALVTTRRRT